jgi:multiple antibiotic resistance protein
MIDYLLRIVPAILVILNPFGAALIFVSLTAGDEPRELGVKAERTAFATAVTLIVFMFLGRFIFQLFHVTLDAFRIAGGVLIFGVGMSMIRGQHPKAKITEKERYEVIEREDITIIPMAIPVLSGPGAIATVMVFRANAQTWQQLVALIGAVLFASLATFFVLRYSHELVRRFGKTSLRIITRIMGLLVVTLSVQFIISGTENVLRHLLESVRTGL